LNSSEKEKGKNLLRKRKKDGVKKKERGIGWFTIWGWEGKGGGERERRGLFPSLLGGVVQREGGKSPPPPPKREENEKGRTKKGDFPSYYKEKDPILPQEKKGKEKRGGGTCLFDGAAGLRSEKR